MLSMHAHSGREKDVEGFEKVGHRRRPTKKPTPPESSNKTQSQNKFELLNTIMEEGEGSEIQEKRKEQ